MIYVGVFMGALVFLVALRADIAEGDLGSFGASKFSITLLGGVPFVAVGALFEVLADRDIGAALLLEGWQAGGTWAIPLGYSLILSGFMNWLLDELSARNKRSIHNHEHDETLIKRKRENRDVSDD